MTAMTATRIDRDRDFVAGEDSADATLVWYVDYTLDYAEAVSDILQTVAHDLYDERVALAFRQAPGPEPSEARDRAARAAVAAGRQGRYMAMHRALLEREDVPEPEALEEIAGDLGLDAERFEADLAADETRERVEADRAAAARAGLEDRAGLIVDGRVYRGAWDEGAVLEALERPLGHRLGRAAEAFRSWAASGGVALILATAAALVLANIGFHETFEAVRAAPISVGIGGWSLSMPVHGWINDGLMTVFFLLVGIEIKREIVDGELSDLSQAALPVTAAAGGMALPALIYAAFNWGTPTAAGWGVPMATDIAFTLGILALLGDRVPTSLKVFVAALAIADDLGAILVIALFYGHGFDLGAFALAGGVFAAMLGLNRARIHSRAPYLALAVALWALVHESGLHATLAGVLTAAAIPTRRAGSVIGAAAHTSALFERELRGARDTGEPISAKSLEGLKKALERLREPGGHVQQALEGWSTYLILPLFAFSNTGIVIAGAGFELGEPAVAGTVAGLVIGKPAGIVLACWIMVRRGHARLPEGMTWTHLVGGACLAGIGFTMSIFIASAAFEGQALQAVKLAVLAASVGSALLGALVLFAAPSAASAEAEGEEP